MPDLWDTPPDNVVSTPMSSPTRPPATTTTIANRCGSRTIAAGFGSPRMC